MTLLPFAFFYFCYFAYNGFFGPFWGLYLDALAFTPWQISLLIALSTLARIVAPGFWGWLADRQGRRRPILVASSLVAMAAFAMLCGSNKHFAWMFCWLAIVHFFWTASLPLVEASTAHLTRKEPGRYSRVRVWGSIGYLLFAAGGGYLLDRVGIGNMPWVVLALLAAIFVASCAVPEAGAPPRERARTPLAATLRQRPVIALFGCCFLMAFAFGPYYTFYSIGLKDAGYDKSAIGWLWAVGVFSEILVFWLMPRIMGAIALERLMLLSLVAAVLRFAMIALSIGNPLLAVLAQLLHAPTFAIHHAASIGLIHRYFAAEHHAKGQGLYIIASFGVGGSLGGLLSGALWSLGGRAARFRHIRRGRARRRIALQPDARHSCRRRAVTCLLWQKFPLFFVVSDVLSNISDGLSNLLCALHQSAFFRLVSEACAMQEWSKTRFRPSVHVNFHKGCPIEIPVAKIGDKFNTKQRLRDEWTNLIRQTLGAPRGA